MSARSICVASTCFLAFFLSCCNTMIRFSRAPSVNFRLSRVEYDLIGRKSAGGLEENMRCRRKLEALAKLQSVHAKFLGLTSSLKPLHFSSA